MQQDHAAALAFDLYSTEHYPFWCLNYFLMLWFLSHITRVFFKRLAGSKLQTSFAKLDPNKQDNVVIYVLQLVGTTVALAAQIYGGADIIFQGKDTTSEVQMTWLLVSIQVVAILYIWELIYRKEIGFPLLIHHLVTIVNSQVVAATFFDTHQIVYIRFAVLIGFHATMEQPSFVALFLYRLGLCSKKWQAFWFNFSAVQTLVFKTMITTVTAVYYIFVVYNQEVVMDGSWGAFWILFFPPMTLCLYGAQAYSCYVLYLLGKKCKGEGSECSLSKAEDTLTEIDELEVEEEPHQSSMSIEV
ncbi:expressed unknown protein [Seminavis robusta]|uniref:TLC domain-containing protein n=1 Tax=Seminavis robusta TaxID=568900 RepID=A0A9N8HKW0_9STRA|nr:expressed unknown protein [Seminavis robusta]|eukprot:Sro977_g227040.1 n/a (301) ;mRNA; r:17456-18358